MRMIIAGSSGFIGSHLVEYFGGQGHELILLSRERGEGNKPYWNPEKRELDPEILEGSDVVINLCGESIFGRWTPKKKEHIRNSRIDSTQLLCSTILGLKVVPKIYIGASAVGYYGNRGEEVLLESSSPGNDFLADVCKNWERISDSLSAKKVRVVSSRFGIVLGKDGGALQQIQKAFRSGMGGVLGSGKQFMSWIAIDDLCSAMQHVIEHTELAGAVNFVAPKSVTNLEFTQTIGRVLNRPTLLSVPKFALAMLFGEGADMFLASVNASPQKLLSSGFQFHYPDLESALKKYLNQL